MNLPESTTVDEVAQVYIDAWKLGVKAIAIYRDNCKVAQPLSGKSDKPATLLAPAGGAGVAAPRRRRLPDDRTEIGRKFRVGEYEGYIHVGVFDDGTAGDIFVDIAKEGTTLAGLMNSFMISVSLGLQYGVPLEVYVSKFAHMRFEPSGLTNDPDIRSAKSIVDYVFRWMGKKFLTVDQQEEVGHPLPGGAGPPVGSLRGRGARSCPSSMRRCRRRARRRSSTRTRTRSSARVAAAGWSVPARATPAATAAPPPAAASPAAPSAHDLIASSARQSDRRRTHWASGANVGCSAELSPDRTRASATSVIGAGLRRARSPWRPASGVAPLRAVRAAYPRAFVGPRPTRRRKLSGRRRPARPPGSRRGRSDRRPGRPVAPSR